MNKKIKLIFNASILSYDYQKTSSRSGIFFVAWNILQEMLKHDDIEIYFYASRSLMYGLKNFKESNPKYANIPILGKFTPINYFLGILEYWKYNCRKLDKKDNLFKKIVRFVTIRILRMAYKHKCIDKSLKIELNKYSVFFSPDNAAPKDILEYPQIKKFTFLHDAIPIVLKDYFFQMKISTSWFKDVYDALNKNDYYFTNSEHTKQDFLKYCDNLNPEHITTTLLGANEKFYQVTDENVIKSIKKKYNIPEDKKFVFSLCTLEPRKNLIFAVKNFVKFIKENNIDDLIFVMGGGHWQLFLETLNKELDGLGEYKNKIISTGYIDDDDLAALYSASEMFVYTSLYEGFGMPVLEAMQCGCACITSNVTSIPEVIGDAGIQINPKSDEEMVEAYKKMYYDKDFKDECRKKALERAKLFSWKKCTDIIVNKIHEVVNEA